MFSIGADRAPGFDGFTAAFYQQFWELVGPDVCVMVRRFFETNEIDGRINKTQLCLIPKISTPKTMSDYRPISLCTVNYKIISKVLIMRLKKCLGSVISDSQAAFVPGRNISDNVLVAHELLHSLKSKKECQSAYLAIKTDISKAYDRVEWNFLEQVMLKLGFDQRWVKWIMECVRTVSYEVLINGSPYGHITPTRGLRQGDPLSPYLFLFCAEVLSQMLHSAEVNNQVHGMKLTRHCPSISHLFFADDSLFFCRSTSEDCKFLASLFERYEAPSGQKINYSKSSIIFGMKIPNQKRERLQQILGINKIGGGGKYLGLPEQFGRKKIELFEHIVTRVKERTEGWSTKFLSPAGKEILIKSIALALPVYSMNCFLLPITICDEITSAISAFWWGKENGKRKIPWVAWDRMTLPKREGGLGFRDLQKFNIALLAKQAWRILRDPSSLITRLYQGIYHPSTTFLKAQTGHYASYGWRSIQEGKELLKRGLRNRIGNGENIRIWEDNWIPTIPPRPAHGPILDTKMTVSDLWLPNKREWDPTIFEGVLTPEDQQLVSTLYLSTHAQQDTHEWVYTKNSKYTVRSGYWVATHVDLAEDEAILPPKGSVDLKQEVWKLKIAPKIQHFIWKCLSEAIATNSQLQSRHIPADPTCQRCCRDEETTNHILFTCPYAQTVWREVQSTIGWGYQFGTVLEDNLQALLSFYKSDSPPMNRLLPIWMLWRIWKSRNDFIFRKINRCHVSETRKGINDVNEWLDTTQIHGNSMTRQQDGRTTSQRNRGSNWIPPLEGWLKCNFDSGFVEGRQFTNSGWIFRDHTGKHFLSGCAKIQPAYTALQA